MIKKPLLFMTLLCLIGVTITQASARELKIAFSYDIPPFIMENASSGLEIDIVREALKLKGHTFTTVQCSYKRLQIAVLQMHVDAAAAVRALEDGTFYSDNFIAFKNYAISKKRDGLTIDRVQDLAGKTIYAWQNAYRDLGDVFENLFSPETAGPESAGYFEIPIQKKQVELFWKGRKNPVIVIDEAIFKWFTKQLASEMNTSAPLVYHNIFDAKTEFQISFKHSDIRDDFNEGLREIRESGLYGKLVEAYR